MDQVARRALLAGGSTATLVAVARAAHCVEAAAPNLAVDYVKIRARMDGNPVYWLSRGVKYLLANYQITPLHGFNMVSCVVADKTGDGFTVRTLEASFAVDVAGTTLVDSFFNPLTKANEKIPAVAPLVVGYDFAPDGAMTLPVADPRRANTDFSGQILPRAGMSSHIAMEERFVVRPKGGGVSALSEVIKYTGVQSSWQAASGMFMRATKTLVVLRNWNFGGGDATAMLLSTYDGQKFLTFDDVIAEAGRDKIEQAQPGFVQKLAAFL
ncbi:MAG: hypothetical protein EXR11_04685 [Rhodospirillaceae bacterium]|nr:hypothetical protein [Rhodospirillaceae bacterium]